VYITANMHVSYEALYWQHISTKIKSRQN